MFNKQTESKLEWVSLSASEMREHISQALVRWSKRFSSITGAIYTIIFLNTQTTAILTLLNWSDDLISFHSEVKQFIEWCDVNHLILNVKKTVVVRQSSYITRQSQVQSYKYLGSTLTWNNQVDWICSRLAYVLFAQTAPIWCRAEDYAHVLPGCPRENPQIRPGLAISLLGPDRFIGLLI